MYKYLLSFAILGSIAYAGELKVKKGDVIITLNGEERALSKGDKITLNDGVLVCFKSGNGRVIINKRRQLTKKSKKCYQSPLPKGFDIETYMKKAKNKVQLALVGNKEEVIHGVSTKSIANLEDGKDIIVDKESENLTLYSKEFGPHPILVILKDEKGNEVASFENEEDDITFFEVKKDSLKTGYGIDVINGFDEVLISKKIILK